jgi:hypothetical protein
MQLGPKRSGWARRIKMLKTNQRISKLGLSLGAALLLTGPAASVARANPLPRSSDEARALAANMLTHATAVRAPVEGAISSTDEARALAGWSLPISSPTAAIFTIVTSTDEARALAGRDRPVPVEIERPDESRAVASTAERD